MFVDYEPDLFVPSLASVPFVLFFTSYSRLSEFELPFCIEPVLLVWLTTPLVLLLYAWFELVEWLFLALLESPPPWLLAPARSALLSGARSYDY